MTDLAWHECVTARAKVAYDEARWNTYGNDFNCDGSATIRDIWQGIKWYAHYPGDMVAFAAFSEDRELANFFEVSYPYHGTYFAAALPFIVLFLIIGWLSD